MVLPAFMAEDLRRHLDWYAEKGPTGLLFGGREEGKPFRRSTSRAEVAQGPDRRRPA